MAVHRELPAKLIIVPSTGTRVVFGYPREAPFDDLAPARRGKI
jgi:hypothetical protein